MSTDPEPQTVTHNLREPAPQFDYCTRSGADRIASDIQNYWHARRYTNVEVWSERIPGTENSWMTKSNLIAGMPRNSPEGRRAMRLMATA